MCTSAYLYLMKMFHDLKRFLCKRFVLGVAGKSSSFFYSLICVCIFAGMRSSSFNFCTALNTNSMAKISWKPVATRIRLFYVHMYVILIIIHTYIYIYVFMTQELADATRLFENLLPILTANQRNSERNDKRNVTRVWSLVLLLLLLFVFS